MARRKAAARRRRSPKGIRLLQVAEGFVQANIVTSTLMRTNPLSFVLGDAGPSFMVEGSGISLLEIAKRPELLGIIAERAMNPENIINIAVSSAVANVGFRFAKRALRRPVNLLNRQIFAPLALGVKL